MFSQNWASNSRDILFCFAVVDDEDDVVFVVVLSQKPSIKSLIKIGSEMLLLFLLLLLLLLVMVLLFLLLLTPGTAEILMTLSLCGWWCGLKSFLFCLKYSSTGII